MEWKLLDYCFIAELSKNPVVRISTRIGKRGISLREDGTLVKAHTTEKQGKNKVSA